MRKFSLFSDKLVTNFVGKPENLLYQRLEEALQHGKKVWIETNSDSFAGIPISLDREFVELLILCSPNEDGSEEESYKRTTWLIRLSHIEAIAYPTEHWSKERLESLLAGDKKASEEPN